ncbi:MAG: YdeI/OmpD-associated family protein [Thermoleophilaceae bacterium]|nr:YdeI/OmpD-associated family protein [Thermoleophilaceae bacterium]
MDKRLQKVEVPEDLRLELDAGELAEDWNRLPRAERQEQVDRIEEEAEGSEIRARRIAELIKQI